MKLDFTLETSAGTHTLQVDVQQLVIAGWAGRNREAIEHHIEELAAIGVPRPSAVPLYYRVAATPGVEHAERMLLSFGQFKLQSGGTQGVQVVGIEKGARLLRPWNLQHGSLDRLDDVDGIVVDQTEFAKLQIKEVGARREISGVRSKVVGLTKGIRSFTTSPFVFANLDLSLIHISEPTRPY